MLRNVGSRAWEPIPAEAAQALKRNLESTSFLDVQGDRPEQVTILVLEDGMWKKPPMLSRLSLQDILKYWSLLSLEQRNEFLSSRAAELLGSAALNGLVAHVPRTPEIDSIFERFAGMFHAFECVREGVMTALEDENTKEALYRLFGTKHDSLGSLLERVRDEVDRDLVDRYVVAMCSRQLCTDVRRTWPEFWKAHASEATPLEATLDSLVTELRAQLLATDADAMATFLPWFEQRFLARAQDVKVSA